MDHSIAVMSPMAVGAVMAVTWPLFIENPITIYLVAVVLSAWIGGLYPGLISLGLSLVIANYFFFQPYYGFGISGTAHLLRLIVAAIVGVFICLVFESLLRQRVRIEYAKLSSDRAKARLSGMIESAMDAIITVDSEQMIVAFNQAAGTMFRYDAADAIGLPIEHFIPERFRSVHANHVRDFGETNETTRSMRALTDTVGLRRDGDEFPVDASISKFESNGQRFYTVILRDLTGRNRTEEKLRMSEERFSKAFLASPAALTITRIADGKFIDVNDSFLRMFEFSRDEALGHSSTELKMWTLEESHNLIDLQVRSEGLSGVELRARARSGRSVDILFSSKPLILEGEDCLVTTMIDITARKEAELKVKASGERLRALSARLNSAREEEGKRISREIHDELGGALTGLRWDIEGIEKDISMTNADNIASIREKFPAVTGIIDSTIDTVRRISSELRPAVLDDLGLAAAIESHASQFQSRTGIRCKFVSNTDAADLGRERATAVFRIFQEILTNVIRHAHAKKVAVRLRENKEYLELTAKDDGRGITDDEKNGTNSLGLLGMHERAVLVGGTISISGSPGKGTTVVVRVPVGG